jgi:endonuclease/exonuclease/phosphatase family metal-dependent hydrolase
MDHGHISKKLANSLKVLQDRIRKSDIASSKIDESVNIATWNIREFGRKSRSDAAIHYIAEILGQFDLIGIVELRDDLTDLGRVLRIMGPDWNAVYSDAISDPGGNHERIAFVFDQRAVRFNGLAAEANAPRKKKGVEYLPDTSWWRSPYMASFRSGNFDFVVLSAHVRWSRSEADREVELQMLANWAEAKRRDEHHEDKDLILMGDFNIPSLTDPLFNIITKRGLRIPDALVGKSFGTDLAKEKRYDQILHYPIYPMNFTNAGGVLDFYDGDSGPLFPGMSKRDFTYEISDHLPLWIQVDTDISGFQLDQIIRGN